MASVLAIVPMRSQMIQIEALRRLKRMMSLLTGQVPALIIPFQIPAMMSQALD